MILLGVIVMAVLAIMWHQINKKPAAQPPVQQMPVAQPAAQPATQPAAMVAQPAAQLPAKSKCSLDSQCASGACAHATAAVNAPRECCAVGSSSYAGFDFCNNMPNGSACWLDNMCANGLCFRGVGGSGVCSDKLLAVGAPCASNRQCSKGACGREGSAVDSTCCINGMTFNYAGNSYCKKV